MSKTIINGIDVSECKHLKNDGIKKPICKSGGCTAVYRSCLCEGNPNCYFKQLKRLQEENKKLKELANEAIIEHENLLINRNDFAERAEKLEQENKELKETINRLQKDCKRNNDLYMKEWDKNYKLSEISKEYNARRCIEKLYRLICDDTKSVQEIYITLKDEVSEFLRIHKTMSAKYEEAKQTYKKALEEIRGFLNPTYFDCKNCKELKKPFTQQNCNGFRYEAILNRINEVLKCQ